MNYRQMMDAMRPRDLPYCKCCGEELTEQREQDMGLCGACEWKQVQRRQFWQEQEVR